MCKTIRNILIILAAIAGVFVAAYALLKYLGFDLPGLDLKCECECVEDDSVPVKTKSKKTETKIKRNYTEINVISD